MAHPYDSSENITAFSNVSDCGATDSQVPDGHAAGVLATKKREYATIAAMSVRALERSIAKARAPAAILAERVAACEESLSATGAAMALKNVEVDSLQKALSESNTLQKELLGEVEQLKEREFRFVCDALDTLVKWAGKLQDLDEELHRKQTDKIAEMENSISRIIQNLKSLSPSLDVQRRFQQIEREYSAKLEILIAENDVLQAELAKSQTSDELLRENDELRAKLQGSETDNNALVQIIEELESEKEELSGTVKTSEQMMEKMREKIAILSTSGDQVKVSDREPHFPKIVEDVKGKGDIEDKEEEIRSLSAKVSELEAELANLKAVAPDDAMEVDIEELKSELNRKNQQFGYLQGIFSSLSAYVEDLEDKVMVLLRERKVMEEELNRLAKV
jgi:chromosome segregation ATPase